MLVSVQGREVWEALGEWVIEAKPDLGPGTKGRFDMASQLQPDEVIQPLSNYNAPKDLLLVFDSIVRSNPDLTLYHLRHSFRQPESHAAPQVSRAEAESSEGAAGDGRKGDA